jgi:MFS family permease
MISRTTRVNTLIGTGHFLSHFYMLILPPLFLVWQPAFHVSFAELGMTLMLMSGVTATLQTPVGFLVDRFGARRFLVGGTLIMSLSICAMGFATSFWQILVLAAVSGIGNSVIHPADYAILTGSVPKDRMGRSFALHSFTGNAGFVFGPPAIALLVPLLGWRGSLVTLGALGVPVVAAILVQSRILVDQPRSHETGPAMSGRQLLMTRPMLLFFGFFFLAAMASAGVQAWVVTVLHQVKGIDLAVASTCLTAYMVGNTGGVLLGGWFADKAKRLATITIALTVASAACTFLVGLLPVSGPVAFAMLFCSGLTLGTSRTPRDIMVKDAAPPGQIGKVFGFISAGLPLGSAITPVPFGYLIDHGRSDLVLALVSTLLLASLLCMGTARTSAHSASAMQPAE